MVGDGWWAADRMQASGQKGSGSWDGVMLRWVVRRAQDDSFLKSCGF